MLSRCLRMIYVYGEVKTDQSLDVNVLINTNYKKMLSKLCYSENEKQQNLKAIHFIVKYCIHFILSSRRNYSGVTVGQIFGLFAKKVLKMTRTYNKNVPVINYV